LVNGTDETAGEAHKGSRIMVKKIAVAGMVVSAFSFMGCSSITLLRIQELKQVEAHVDSLKAELTERQALLEKEQKSQNELLRLIRADMQVRFEELGQKFTTLEGSISESKYRLTQIDKKTQEIQEQWKAKTAADSTAASQKKAQVEKLYQIAYGDFMAGRFDLAANGFMDLVNQYPESPYTDEATYWYAECFFGKKEYEKAEQLYSDYLRKYREGKKVCASLYKLGLVFETRKQMEKRKMAWQKLQTNCPDSQEAATVKERLGK
jgi:tol-pal system protein YbgF